MTDPTPRRAAGTVAPVAASAAPRRPAAPRGRAAHAGPSGIPVLDGPAPLTSSPPRISGPHNAAARAPVPARGVPDADNTPRAGSTAAVLSSGQKAIAAAMSEAELEEGIRALCNDLGILRFHVRDSRGMTRGLPDDILVGAGGVAFWECKTEKGRLTVEQKAVGAALKALGQRYAVRRPSHLVSGQIARELAALAGLNARMT